MQVAEESTGLTVVTALYKTLKKALLAIKKQRLDFRGTHVLKVRLRFHDLASLLSVRAAKPLRLALFQRFIWPFQNGPEF